MMLASLTPTSTLVPPAILPKPDVSLGLERLTVEPYEQYVFFRGSLEAFDAQFSKVIARYQPELVARFPQVDVDENSHGFLAGVAIRTTRDDTPCLWVALAGARHFHLEQLIKEHGTSEEQAKVQRYKRGFITNSGRMVSRMSARRIAVKAGQLLEQASSGLDLYSDDVW